VIISDPSGNSIGTSIKNTTMTIKEASSEPQEVFYDSFEQGAWNGLWTEGRRSYGYDSVQRAVDGKYSAEVDGWARDAP
jgi:hypothetical protein